MNTCSETKLTERTVNLPENRGLTAKLHSTYQRRNSTPSQFVWRNDRTEEHSKALREFIKNAEDNFDNTKEKAVAIYLTGCRRNHLLPNELNRQGNSNVFKTSTLSNPFSEYSFGLAPCRGTFKKFMN